MHGLLHDWFDVAGGLSPLCIGTTRRHGRGMGFGATRTVLRKDKILHHLESMEIHCLWVFTSISSFYDFLGGAGFRPSTVGILLMRNASGDACSDYRLHRRSQGLFFAGCPSHIRRKKGNPGRRSTLVYDEHSCDEARHDKHLEPRNNQVVVLFALLQATRKGVPSLQKAQTGSWFLEVDAPDPCQEQV